MTENTANERELVKGDQIATINVSDHAVAKEWGKPYEESDDKIITYNEDGSAYVYKAMPKPKPKDKEEAKA